MIVLCVCFSDVNAGVHEKNGWGNRAYSVSKVGVSALTMIQHRNFLKDPRMDIVINAVSQMFILNKLIPKY